VSRYLIVTHKTAFSAELRDKVEELVARDASAEFAILVPEVLSVDYSWEGKSVDVAGQRAESARLLLEETLNAKVAPCLRHSRHLYLAARRVTLAPFGPGPPSGEKVRLTDHPCCRSFARSLDQGCLFASESDNRWRRYDG
jgi:hypothetical protein